MPLLLCCDVCRCCHTVAAAADPFHPTKPCLNPCLLMQVAREVDERSLYASPFPFDATLDALSDFFRQVGGLEALPLCVVCLSSCWQR